MKKRLLISLVLGLLFTPSAYASCHMDFTLKDAHCVQDDDGSGDTTIKVQADSMNTDDPCPLTQAYAGSGHHSGIFDVDGGGGSGYGRTSAGVASGE